MAGEHIIKHNNGIIIDGTGDGASPDTGITLKSYIFQYTSGSTKVIEYINTNNTLQLSANTTITGSLVVNGGSGVELQVASTGVTLGNVIGDTHRITGSLNISGSTTLRGNTLITGSLTTSGSIIALPGSVTAPSYAFVGSTNYGMFLNGTTLSLVNNGTSIINITSDKQVILPNTQANTATAGLLSVGHIGFPIRANASATNYYPAVSIVPDGAQVAGGLGLFFDNTATYGGIVLTAGNASGTIRPIPRVVLKLTNLVNTNDTESADFSIASKIAGAPSSSLVERLRVTSTGTTIISGTFAFSATSSAGPTGSRGRYNGEIVTFGAGTLTAGQLYFLSSSSTWSLANANSTGSSTGMLGIAVGTTPSDGLLIRGFAYSASYTTATGSIVYAATSSGLMTISSPSSSNHVVRVVGYVTNIPNTIYFDPDKTWVTLA